MEAAWKNLHIALQEILKKNINLLQEPTTSKYIEALKQAATSYPNDITVVEILTESLRLLLFIEPQPAGDGSPNQKVHVLQPHLDWVVPIVLFALNSEKAEAETLAIEFLESATVVRPTILAQGLVLPSLPQYVFPLFFILSCFFTD